MATAVSTGSGNWSDAIWSGGSGSGGAPADGDAVTISQGHEILMDVDMSGWTNGLGTVTITGHNSLSPAMLYFKDGTSGWLKVKTGNIVGTNNTNRGRILANSDGVWGNTGALGFSYKAVIDLQTTAKIDALYLDLRLYCTQPTNKYIEVYKNVYTCSDQTTGVDVGTNVITFGSTPPANGTVVMVRSSGTLPAGLFADEQYYVRGLSGNTCKLALGVSNDSMVVDITSTGSGTLTMYDGLANASSGNFNIIQDVTGDTGWTTDSEHNRVTLCSGLQGADTQRATLTSLSSTIIQLGTPFTQTDSVQSPCARVYLISRNVSIRQTQTTVNSQVIVDFGANTVVTNSVFQCEILNTSGTGNLFGYGISSSLNYNIGITVSGTIGWINYGINSGNGHNISAVICCGYGIVAGNAHNFTGYMSSGTYACSGGTGYSVAGDIYGVGNATSNTGISHVFSGNIYGSSTVISGCNLRVTGTVKNCNYVTAYATIDGVIESSALLRGVAYVVYGGKLTIKGTLEYCGYLLRGGYSICYLPHGHSFVNLYGYFYERNTNLWKKRAYFEDYNGTVGDNRIMDEFGDIIKVACDGSGTRPSVDPLGGNDYCLEVSSVQSNCNSTNPLVIFDKHRIWLAADVQKTITYKIQTDYADGISAGNLELTATYVGTDGALTEATNAPAIATRDDTSDWSKTLAVTITPTQDHWVILEMKLMEYESGKEVYVWPTPTIT